MITLRRANERHHDRHRTRRAWLTFHPQDRTDPLGSGFGALELLDEDRLSPAASLSHRPPHDAEIVTYVREGALAYEDSVGGTGVIQAGEFQYMTASRNLRHRETNASRVDGAHVFRITLRPSKVGVDCACVQKRFTTAQRRNVLCVIASPDGREGSLRLLQGTLICSAMLAPGQHLVHELSQRRSAWFHLVQGEVTLADLVLSTGDGVGIRAERAVSFTAQEETEILLFDLEDQSPGPPEKGGVR